MRRFWHDLFVGEEAATSVEYAVMLGLVLMVAIIAIATLGTTNADLWQSNADTMNTAIGGS